MLSLSTFTRLAFGANLLAQIPLLNASPLLQQRETGSLDSFTTTELPIALQGILNNIGPAGALVPGAAPGLVIASPTQNNPDCTYHHSTMSSLSLFSSPSFIFPIYLHGCVPIMHFVLCTRRASFPQHLEAISCAVSRTKIIRLHAQAKGVGAHSLINTRYSLHILLYLLLSTGSITV